MIITFDILINLLSLHTVENSDYNNRNIIRIAENQQKIERNMNLHCPTPAPRMIRNCVYRNDS